MQEIDTEDIDWDEDNEDDEAEACDTCGRGLYDSGQCPDCCPLGQYSPGSEMCDCCEYSGECAEGIKRN